MAKVEITKEQTVCDRCGSRVTPKGKQVQFIEGHGLRCYDPTVSGLSFHAELCKGCADSLTKWWEKKAGDA
jgi:hypothetical protein